MLRIPIWATAFACVAGVSLAAPSPELSERAPVAQQPALAEESSWEALERSVEEVGATEEFQIAGKGRGGGRGGGGGHRAGATDR